MGGNEETYFSWLALVESVSDLTKDKWDDVFTKNIYEFFNLLAYLKHRNQKQKEMIDKWKRSH